MDRSSCALAMRMAVVIASCTIQVSWVSAQTFYVATNGNDSTGNGSLANPWASIGGALARLHDNQIDGATVLVRPGTYTGRQSLVGTFTQGVTVRSEVPYQARIRHTSQAVVAYQNNRGASGITLEGFDIAHSGAGASPLVFHIDGGGGNSGVGNITVRNNVIHDSYNNDLLKINNGVTNVLVEGNMFYNQTGSDEHLDINSIEDVTVRDNVFFNDFAGSGRTNGNNTGSFIVIKDSNDDEDIFVGSNRVNVERNVFLNWEGGTGSNFVLVGEDGKPFIEARNVMIENNLMLGNSANVMRSALGIKSGEQVTFRNNTVTGDLPSLAYAMRVNVENSAVINDEIHFYNNIWSDPTGTMGSSGSGANDFSDTPPSDVVDWTLLNNQYYNGGAAIPTDSNEEINYGADPDRIVADPGLPSLSGIVLPRWNATTGQFADGSATIREAFVNLVMQYGVPASNSDGVDHALPGQSPPVDILGNPRGASPDIGAFEILAAATSGDFDGDGDVDGRDFLVWQRDPSVGALADWQENYGAGAAAVVARSVPEPQIATILAGILIGTLLRAKWRWTTVCTVLCAVLSVSNFAQGVVLESAELGTTGRVGGTSLTTVQYVGWRFEVSEPLIVERVGGHLTSYPDVLGDLFAALVRLPAIDAFPLGAPFIEEEVVATTTFRANFPSDEFLTPLSAEIDPGNYALVFGTGLFGATGEGAIHNGPDQPDIPPTDIGSYIFFSIPDPNTPPIWRTNLASNMRFVIEAKLAEPPGDFDDDRDVDGSDFLVWQRGESPVPLSAGDLSSWQQNYGTGIVEAESIAVPEPPAAGLLFGPAFGAGTARMRKKDSVRCCRRLKSHSPA